MPVGLKFSSALVWKKAKPGKRLACLDVETRRYCARKSASMPLLSVSVLPACLSPPTIFDASADAIALKVSHASRPPFPDMTSVPEHAGIVCIAARKYRAV